MHSLCNFKKSLLKSQELTLDLKIFQKKDLNKLVHILKQTSKNTESQGVKNYNSRTCSVFLDSMLIILK